MKNRTSSHVFILALIVVVTAIGHYAIYYGALIRGYETSSLTAWRNLFLLSLLAVLPIALKKFVGFEGNWTLFTAAILLFSIGLTVQYRLFSDPEYTSRQDKSSARQEKIKVLQQHYIQENYSADKKQMMGLPPTPPSPVDLSAETPRSAPETLLEVIFSGKTLNPLLGIVGLIAAFILFRRNDILELLQKNGFLMVVLTLGPLLIAAIWSRGGMKPCLNQLMSLRRYRSTARALSGSVSVPSSTPSTAPCTGLRSPAGTDCPFPSPAPLGAGC